LDAAALVAIPSQGLVVVPANAGPNQANKEVVNLLCVWDGGYFISQSSFTADPAPAGVNLTVDANCSSALKALIKIGYDLNFSFTAEQGGNNAVDPMTEHVLSLDG